MPRHKERGYFSLNELLNDCGAYYDEIAGYYGWTDTTARPRADPVHNSSSLLAESLAKIEPSWRISPAFLWFNGSSMDPSIFKTFGEIAGIGGLVLGVLLVIFRDVIAKVVFSALSPADSYKLMRLLIVLTFLIACVGLGAWVWTTRPVVPTATSQTWRDNYALFGARPFPQVQTTTADHKTFNVDNRATMLADLHSLLLDDGGDDLKSKYDNLNKLVENAPKWNADNAGWFIVDDGLETAYSDFKAALRQAAYRHGVDVGEVDKEQFPGSKKVGALPPTTAPQPAPVPKRIEKTAERDSAEVNYGCETTINDVTTGIIQLGANPKDVDAQADWPVAVNAKNKTAAVAYEHNAQGEITSIRGVGSVTGKDKVALNCPGGGNGHIHLHAKWTEDQS